MRCVVTALCVCVLYGTCRRLCLARPLMEGYKLYKTANPQRTVDMGYTRFAYVGADPYSFNNGQCLACPADTGISGLFERSMHS